MSTKTIYNPGQKEIVYVSQKEVLLKTLYDSYEAQSWGKKRINEVSSPIINPATKLSQWFSRNTISLRALSFIKMHETPSSLLQYSRDYLHPVKIPLTNNQNHRIDWRKNYPHHSSTPRKDGERETGKNLSSNNSRNDNTHINYCLSDSFNLKYDHFGPKKLKRVACFSFF